MMKLSGWFCMHLIFLTVHQGHTRDHACGFWIEVISVVCRVVIISNQFCGMLHVELFQH